jgi:hypothetical protein
MFLLEMRAVAQRMYSFRLVYYLFWHIGGGYIRLKVLF